MRTPLFRNAYALILNSAATSGLGILYWMLAARLYPAEVVGVNSAIIAAMMLLSTLSRVNLGDALLRFLPRAGRMATRLVGYSYLVAVVLALVVGVLLYIGLNFVPTTLTFLRGDSVFTIAFILATMAWSVFGLQDYVLTGARQAVWVPIENGAFALLKIILLIAFAATFTAYGIYISWTIPVVLSLVPVNWLIFRYVLPRHASESVADSDTVPNAESGDWRRANAHSAPPASARQIGEFAVGNYVGALFWMAATMLLPIIVTEMLGAKANAYFYQPWLIASSLQLIVSNMSMSLTVEASRNQARLQNYSRRVLTHTAKLLVPLVGVTIIAAPFVLRVYGEEYANQGTLLLQLLALSAFPYLIMRLYLSRASVEGNLNALVSVQAVFCALVLGFSIALLPMLGIVGVGWAWLGAQCLVALLLIANQLRPRLREEVIQAT